MYHFEAAARNLAGPPEEWSDEAIREAASVAYRERLRDYGPDKGTFAAGDEADREYFEVVDALEEKRLEALEALQEEADQYNRLLAENKDVAHRQLVGPPEEWSDEQLRRAASAALRQWYQSGADGSAPLAQIVKDADREYYRVLEALREERRAALDRLQEEAVQRNALLKSSWPSRPRVRRKPRGWSSRS